MWKKWKIARNNYKRNRKTIIKNLKTKINFRDRVILIGAGKSVSAELEKLKNVNLENITVCCCDIAYKHLYKHINIDYVFTLEPAESKFFENIKEFNSVLIAYAGTSAKTIRDWHGKILFFDMITNDNIILKDNLKYPWHEVGLLGWKDGDYYFKTN